MDTTNPPKLSGIKKIAIFRALQLGDLLCAVPAFRSLRQLFPYTHITLIGLPWEESLLKRFPDYLDAFIRFPGYPGLPEQKVDPTLLPHFLQRVQEERFSLALQMQGNGSIVNPLVELFGATYTAGFYTEGSYCPNKRLFRLYPENEHEIVRQLTLIALLGDSQKDTSLEFPLHPEEYEEYNFLQKKFGLEKRNYVCIHPGARDPRRRWKPEYFACIADILIKKGYKVIFTGSEDEKYIIDAIKTYMTQEVIDLSGKTTIGGLALLIKYTQLLLTNDTSVSHIASAYKTPSVIIFLGFSDPKRWAPLDTSLHKVIQPLEAKDPQIVLNTVKNMLLNHIGLLPFDTPYVQKGETL